MKKVAIIGFGRFGQLLASLLEGQFEISIVEVNEELGQQATDLDYDLVTLSEIANAEHIFLAVPISRLEAVVKEIAPYVDARHTVTDVCSVKVYPAEVLGKHLPHCQTIASHPLFGPDSASKGLSGLKIVLCRLKVSDENFSLWSDFWRSKGVDVIEATPEQHDKDSVYSQAFTYSLARIILEMDIPDLRFTTRSYNDIKEVAELSAKDSDELFHDMLFYNPYFKEMKAKLEKATSNVIGRLETIGLEQG